MIQWLKADGSVQYSKDRRYCIVHATEANWIAYRLTPLNTGEELGTSPTDAEARATCERHAQARAA